MGCIKTLSDRLVEDFSTTQMLFCCIFLLLCAFIQYFNLMHMNCARKSGDVVISRNKLNTSLRLHTKFATAVMPFVRYVELCLENRYQGRKCNYIMLHCNEEFEQVISSWYAISFILNVINSRGLNYFLWKYSQNRHQSR